MRAEVVPGCGACGRREVCGVWLWCLWAARGLRGLVVVPVGGGGACGVWLWCLWAAAGPGRASRSTTPSEARVWRSRGRAAAHRHNRPDQVGRLRGDGGRCEVCGVWLWCLWAAAGPGAGLLAAMRGRREACGAWPGFETTRRAKLVARTASGRAGLAPPGSVVAKLPRGSEVGRSSASGGVEVEEGD